MHFGFSDTCFLVLQSRELKVTPSHLLAPCRLHKVTPDLSNLRMHAWGQPVNRAVWPGVWLGDVPLKGVQGPCLLPSRRLTLTPLFPRPLWW